MSVEPSELTAREHSEMRDLVLAGAQRIRPVGAYRAQFTAIGIALILVGGGVVGGVLATTIGGDGAPAPIATNEPAPQPTPTQVPGGSGWTAYSSGFGAGDVFLVREGSAPHRVVGSDGDGIDQVCPAFSPDGMLLASGQATGGDAGAGQPSWQDPALVITDVSADGVPGDSRVIPLDGLAMPPCPIWSSDGRWIAFGAGTGIFAPVPEVWVVDTVTEETRRLTGLAATDIEWAADGSSLYIADDEGVLVYSVGDGDISTIADTAGAVSVATSPEGGMLAVERTGGEPGAPDALITLWLMTADGSDRRILAEDYTSSQGVGPVWSPDGNRIVYQRACTQVCADLAPDLRQDEIVVVVVAGGDPLGDIGTQSVLPTVRTAGSDEARRWVPVTVTWAPDSATLRVIGWELTASGDMRAGSGLLAVPVADPGASVILWETPEGIGMSGIIPRNDFQSWSR